MAGFELPALKRRAIVAEFGEPGRQWVKGFPALLSRCVQRWQLKLLDVAPPAGLPINMIFYAEGPEGEPVVLKVGHPHPELLTEMKTLALYNGRGAARLIDASEELSAILMERVLPGTKLRDIGNDLTRSRTRIELMDTLPIRVDANPGLPTFDQWLDKAFAEFRAGPAPDFEFLQFVEWAEKLYNHLRGQDRQDYVLHGDLHHENILLDEHRDWLAIDPKGVVGPKIMEVGRYLHNFIADEIADVSCVEEASPEAIQRVLEERFTACSEIPGASRRDLVAATWVDLILSTTWSINSDHDYRHGIHIARALRPALDAS